MNKDRRKIDTIVIHCSDSDWGCASVIDKWHRERDPDPFDRIGYHFVINNAYPDGVDKKPNWERDGLIEHGRDIADKGAHVRGHNATSIGICLIGKRSFTGKQFDSLKDLYRFLCKEVGNTMRVVGHYELDSSKTCPNIDADWLRTHLGIKE